jgi:short-subunit dehydrogenase
MFSRLDLRGARTIVTGASSGIGWALALRLAERGARVAVAGRRRERLDELTAAIAARGGQAVAVPADVTDPEQRARLIDKTVESLGGVDILVNNAGVGAMGYFTEATPERLRQLFEVNFFSVTELTRLAIPHLKQGRDPMLVNVGSVIGRRGVPGCAEYCASKFALSGWTEALRPELALFGIHVLLVCPGLIQTEFREHLIEDRGVYRWQNSRAMTADRCAELIVRAMRRRKNELVTTGSGKFLVWLNRLLPRLVDRILLRYARKETT